MEERLGYSHHHLEKSKSRISQLEKEQKEVKRDRIV